MSVIPAEVDRFGSDLIELSTRDNFVFWLTIGTVWRGWARSASGNTAEGIPYIEQGIKDYRERTPPGSAMVRKTTDSAKLNWSGLIYVNPPAK